MKRSVYGKFYCIETDRSNRIKWFALKPIIQSLGHSRRRPISPHSRPTAEGRPVVPLLNQPINTGSVTGNQREKIQEIKWNQSQMLAMLHVLPLTNFNIQISFPIRHPKRQSL